MNTAAAQGNAALNNGTQRSSTPLHIEGVNVTYAAQDTPALNDVTWTPPQGQLSAIIGPNGAGKSTLLKATLGLIPINSGVVHFWGAPLNDQGNNQRARTAYMAQLNDIDWDFPISVLDVVKMGLYASVPWYKRLTKAHTARAMDALTAVQMQDLGARQIGQLSGGQRRRVFLARCLAQNADLIFMDEPFAGVDVKAGAIILNVLRDLKAAGKTIIVVHHDLNTVKSVFDHVLILNKAAVASGVPKDVMTKDTLSRAYGGSLIA